MLNVRVRHGTGIYCRILHVFDILLVRLDVLNLKTPENLLIFVEYHFFAARFNRLNSFFQPSGFRCRSLSILIFQKNS